MERVIFSESEIASAVDRIAAELNARYRDATSETPVLAVCVLKGATLFFADLVRKLTFPLEFDFLRAKSYGTEQHSSGAIELTRDVETSFAGRRVLLVDEIVDSGATLAYLTDFALRRGAADVKTAVLVAKRRPRDFEPDFAALLCAPVFLAGYGLDDVELRRNLPYIVAID